MSSSQRRNAVPRKPQNHPKDDVNNKLTCSLRNLSLGITTIPVAVVIKKKFQITSYVQKYLVAWTNNVFAKVGPGKKEIYYHDELRDLLLTKGFDVGYEVPLKFQRLGSKPVAKRVDLIISMPGISEKVLIECKAKKKIEKKDFKQVIFYQHHFGIPECYLINFRHNPEVRRLK